MNNILYLNNLQKIRETKILIQNELMIFYLIKNVLKAYLISLCLNVICLYKLCLIALIFENDSLILRKD